MNCSICELFDPSSSLVNPLKLFSITRRKTRRENLMNTWRFSNCFELRASSFEWLSRCEPLFSHKLSFNEFINQGSERESHYFHPHVYTKLLLNDSSSRFLFVILSPSCVFISPLRNRFAFTHSSWYSREDMLRLFDGWMKSDWLCEWLARRRKSLLFDTNFSPEKLPSQNNLHLTMNFESSHYFSLV